MMGLDFSHGEAHWSYSGFDLFRRMVASVIMEVDGVIDDLYDERMLYRYMTNEPIYPFINHSDCDGELTPEELKQIIPQLEEVLNKMEEQDHYQYDIDHGRELLKGMRLALSKDENLEFH